MLCREAKILSTSVTNVEGLKVHYFNFFCLKKKWILISILRRRHKLQFNSAHNSFKN
jgi:hypothetical protein